MSRVDDLRAEIFDLEDSLTCLIVDHENAVAYVGEIEDKLYRVRCDIASSRRNLILTEGEKNV